MLLTALHRLRAGIVYLALLAFAAPALCANDKELSTWDKYQIYLKYQNGPTIIREGKGLKAVTLGMPFAAVLKKLGNPAQRKGYTLLNRTRAWVYRLDPNTQLQVTGQNTVSTISLRGTSKSAYTTAAGARFGMPAFQIRMFYSTDPVQASTGILDYPFRGVRFIFHNGNLNEITVYPPKPR